MLHTAYGRLIVWLLVFSVLELCIAAPQQPAGIPAADDSLRRTAWMKQARWGVMTHYLADWQARNNNLEMSVEQWNGMVDGFDVEGLADQLKAAGAGYHILTIRGMGEPRFTAEQAVQFSKKVWQAEGVITWDVPVAQNGLIPNSFIAELKAINQASAAYRTLTAAPTW